jgi:hypothetical protein
MVLDKAGADDGAYSLQLEASKGITDQALNANAASAAITFTYDCTPPSVAASSSTTSETKVTPISVTYTFSEAVTGFIAGDLTVAGGTLGSLTNVDSIVYTIPVTPSGQGTVTLDLPSSKVVDNANLPNSAAAQFVRIFDTVAPTVAITHPSVTQVAGYTNVAPIPITVTFTEANTLASFLAAQVTTGGVALTSKTLTAVSNKVFTVGLTPSVEGTLTAQVAAAAVADAATNDCIASNVVTFVYDITRPTVSMSSSHPTYDKLNPIPVTIQFSEDIDVTTFVVGDLTVTNGAADSATFTQVLASRFTVEVIPAAQGSLDVTLAANAITDFATNLNTAGTINFVYDTVAPTGSIASSEGSFTPTSPIPFTVTWVEAVTGFTVGDITVTGGTITTSSFATVSAAVYTFTVTPSAEGTVTALVAANKCTDLALNSNQATTTTSIVYDFTHPSVAIPTIAAGDAIGGSAATKVSPVTVTVTFSEPVNGFATDDFTLGGVGGSVGTITPGALNTVFTTPITPTSEGTLTVTINLHAVTDNAGNSLSAASSVLSFVYDATNPTVGATSSQTFHTNANPIPVTLTFNENVYALAVGDAYVANAAATAISPSTSGAAVYTLDITPSVTDGIVHVVLDAGVATDLATNPNDASNTMLFHYDGVVPTATLTSSPLTYSQTSPWTVRRKPDEIHPSGELFLVPIRAQISSDCMAYNGRRGPISPSCPAW